MKEWREGEKHWCVRETSMCGCLSHAPHLGPGLQHSHVPRLGIEPATLGWQASIQSTEPHQPGQYVFWMSHVQLSFSKSTYLNSKLFTNIRYIFIFINSFDGKLCKYFQKERPLSLAHIYIYGERERERERSPSPKHNHSFIHSVIIYYLLCAKYCKKCW